MKDLNLTTRISVCEYQELSKEDRELVDVAKQMVAHSYSPYSNFKVGAAARLSDGRIHAGANQENAAYPSGLCAERTTLFSANALYPELSVTTLAIAAFTNGAFTEIPTAPCGGCRQVMLETEDRYKQPMKVILYGSKQIYVISSAAELMPLTFVKDDLHA